MKNNTNVLFVSSSSADETVLGTLLARNGVGKRVTMATVSNAQRFFEAVSSKHPYHAIVIDDRQEWARWQSIVEMCTERRPNALIVLLVASENTGKQCEGMLGDGVAAAYPRNSVGLLALARLVVTMVAQTRLFRRRSKRAESASATVEAADVERESLVYAVSHDLQDPLQLARRYAAILNDDYDEALGQGGSKVLGHLQFNLDRTQEMLDELLDYSRLQGAMPERVPVDMNDLLDEVTSLFKMTLQEIGGAIVRQPDMPVLLVDPRQMQRVFQNLIGNAIKFRSERPLRMVIRAQRVRDEWRIGIKDNGIGIADDDTKRIFGMFERVGGTEDYPGTGMGLAICKRIIKNHGGKIWARSSLGDGSVFIFSVPQADDAAVQLPG